MIIASVRLSRAAGTQGSLAKVLLAGASQDCNHGLVWSSLLWSASGVTSGTACRLLPMSTGCHSFGE